MTVSENDAEDSFSSSRFLRNTKFHIVGQATMLAFGVVTSIILARWLGPDQRGVLALVLLLPTTLHALLASGLPAPIIYYVANRDWTGPDITKRVFGLGCWALGAMFVSAIPVLAFRDVILPNVPTPLLVLSLLLLPVQLFQAGMNAILSGKSAFRLQMMSNLILAPISMLIVATFVIVMDGMVLGALIATILSSVIGCLLASIFVSRLLKWPDFWQVPEVRPRKLKAAFAYGARSHAANLAGYLNYRVDMFLLSAFLGAANVGIYVVAVGLAEKLWLLVSNFAAVLFPASAEQSKNDPEGLAKFTCRLAAVMLLLLTIVALCFAAVAIPLVSIAFGAPYRDAGWLIILLLPGIVALGYTKILANYIAGAGRPGINAIASSIGVVVNVGANLLLIPRLGLVGAAVSTSISYTTISLCVYLGFIRISKATWHAALFPQASDLKAVVGRIFNGQNRAMSGAG